MKANNGSGNNERRDSWQTDQKLFDILNKQYKFIFDCCATENNTKCKYYSNDFLSVHNLDLNYIVWMNPPFSKAKEMFSHFFKIIHKGVAIYRCDNLETYVWQKIIFPNIDWLFIHNKCFCYQGLGDGIARFPSALIGVGVEPPKDLEGIILVRFK